MATPQVQLPPQTNDGTVAFNIGRILSPAEDPRTRRYGYGAGILSLEVHPRQSGRSNPVIPQGQLVPFRSTSMREQRYESARMDDKGPKDEISDKFTARYFIDNAITIAQSMGDTGFRELTPLTPLTDEEGQAVFAYLHPPIIDCPSGLDVWGCCATCRLESLSRIEPRNEVEAATWNILVEANETYRNFALMSWNALADEYRRGKANQAFCIATLRESHLHYMRHVHAEHPEMIQARVAQQYADQNVRTTEAIVEGLKTALQPQPDTRLAALEERLAAQDEQIRNLTEKRSTRKGEGEK